MGRFCRNCGTQLDDQARFCTACGATSDQSMQTSHNAFNPGAPSSPAYSPVRQKKKRSVLIILVGLLLVLSGLFSMSLSIAGKTAAARITDVRQDTDSYGDSLPDPTRYRIKYEFSVDGERYTGGDSVRFPRGVRSDQNIQVRYLAFAPGMNSPASEVKVTTGLILIGLGGALIFLGSTGKLQVSRRR